jgi:hypothetical protein
MLYSAIQFADEIQKSRSWKIQILDFLHPSQHPTEPPHCFTMIPPQVFALVSPPIGNSPPARPPSIDDLKIEAIVPLVLIPKFLEAIAVVLLGHGYRMGETTTKFAMPHPKKNTQQYPVTLTPQQIQTLHEVAYSMGFIYGGRGSISLLIQAWADFLGGWVDKET